MIVQYPVERLQSMFPKCTYQPAMQGKISIVLDCGDSLIKAAPYFAANRVDPSIASAVSRWVFGNQVTPRATVLSVATRLITESSHILGFAPGNCTIDAPRVYHQSDWHYSIWGEPRAPGVPLSELPPRTQQVVYRAVLKCAGFVHSQHTDSLLQWYEQKFAALLQITQSDILSDSVRDTIADCCNYGLDVLRKAVSPIETTTSFHADLRAENLKYDRRSHTCWLLDMEQSYGSRDWLTELWKAGAISSKPNVGTSMKSELLQVYAGSVGQEGRDYVQAVFSSDKPILDARFELMRIEQFACYLVLCSLMNRPGYEYKLRGIILPGAQKVAGILQDILARR